MLGRLSGVISAEPDFRPAGFRMASSGPKRSNTIRCLDFAWANAKGAFAEKKKHSFKVEPRKGGHMIRGPRARVCKKELGAVSKNSPMVELVRMKGQSTVVVEAVPSRV
jgi:hypothetical protein